MSLPVLDGTLLADLQQLSDLTGVVDAQQRTLHHLLGGSPPLLHRAPGAAGAETATAGAARTAGSAGPAPAAPGRAG